MNYFDKCVNDFLFEEIDDKYDFDLKKVFYILPEEEDEFLQRLEELKVKDPLRGYPHNLPPAKKPMFQLGEYAGKIADPRLWAEALMSYYDTYHNNTIVPVQVLRNCQVKPNDKALYNFYKDIKYYFGDITEYELPKHGGITRTRDIVTQSRVGSLLKSVFRAPKLKSSSIGTTIRHPK